MNENIKLAGYDWLIVSFLLISLLGLHLGFSEFLSFQFLYSFVLFCFVLFRGYIFSLKAIFNAIFPFLIGVTIIIVNQETINTFLWFSRVCLMAHTLLTFYYLLQNISLQELEKIKAIFEKAFEYFAFFTFFMVVMQLAQITLFNTTNFLLPIDMYALNYGTLDARSLRPSGFFSEPSTLGLVGSVIAAYGLLSGRNIFLILGVFIAITSLALSALIMLFFLFIGYSLISKRINIFGIFGLIVIGIIFIVAFAQDYLIQRLNFIMQGEDNSVYVRFTFPVEFILSQFQDGKFFGTSNYNLTTQAIISGTSSVPKDNYIFNMIIFSGLASIPILCFQLLSFPGFITFILLGLSFVNGDIFYYDRVILVSFCLVFYSFNKRKGTL